MCTLALYFRALPGLPLVVAANRDELLRRPTLEPGLLAGEPEWIHGGRDEIHGGTWLGLNASGVVAALLNRRGADPIDHSRRSRGLLCLDALREPSASAARRVVEGLSPFDYNPFNLLVADASAAWVATNHAGALRVRELTEGLHLLTNLDINDATCPRIAGSVQMFSELTTGGALGAEGLAPRLQPILASHDTPLDPRDPLSGNSLCFHLDEYGTRSSTIVSVDTAGRWRWDHCGAAPCRGSYVTLPLPGRVDA